MATIKGQQVQTAILIDATILAVIDGMAAREGVSRSDILRRLIRRGLEMEQLLSTRR